MEKSFHIALWNVGENIIRPTPQIQATRLGMRRLACKIFWNFLIFFIFFHIFSYFFIFFHIFSYFFIFFHIFSYFFIFLFKFSINSKTKFNLNFKRYWKWSRKHRIGSFRLFLSEPKHDWEDSGSGQRIQGSIEAWWMVRFGKKPRRQIAFEYPMDTFQGQIPFGCCG